VKITEQKLLAVGVALGDVDKIVPAVDALKVAEKAAEENKKAEKEAAEKRPRRKR